MRHSKLEIARQAAVVGREGPLPFSELCQLAGVSERTLIRWAAKGKGGVLLEAVHDRRERVWYSSRAAVLRFIAATADADDAA